jgi:L-methionine (R)-S-oxide reductase
MEKIINQQIKLFCEENDGIAALANISACINENYHRLNWAGFYIVRQEELVLGPFQGKVACMHIPFQKGVCGKCYTTKMPQRIADVLSFPGHIACDSASRSELCVPIIVNNSVIGEIDLDAPEANHFTEEMEKEMLEAASDIAQAYLQHNWKF